MASQKRVLTKYPGVYFNKTTQKNDIKYNFKVYNPVTQKMITSRSGSTIFGNVTKGLKEA